MSYDHSCMSTGFYNFRIRNFWTACVVNSPYGPFHGWSAENSNPIGAGCIRENALGSPLGFYWGYPYEVAA